MMDEPPNETKNDSDAFSPASSPRTPASAPRIRSSAFHNTVPFSDPQIASYNSDSSPPLQHSPSTSSKNIHDEDVDVDVDETSRRGSSTARQFRHLHNVDDRLMSSLRQQGDVLMRSSKKRMKSADIRHYRSNSHTKKGSKKKKLKKTKDVARRSSISSRGVGGGDVLPSLSNASISLKLPHPVDECRSLTHNSTPPNSSSGINDLIAEFKTTTPRHREGESDASLFDALMMEKLAMDTSLSTRNRHHSADVSLRHHHHQHQEASPQRRGIVDETQEHHVQVDAAYAITSPEHSHSLLSSGASPLNPPTTSRPQPLKISSKPAKRYSEVVDDVRQHKKSTSISHHQHRQGRRSVSPYETPHSPTHTTTSASSTSAKVNAIGTKPTKKSKSSKPSGDTLPLGGSLNDVIARFDQLVAARQKRANENKKKLATGNIINNNTSSDSHGDARSPPAAQHSKRGTSSSSWNHHHGRRSPSTGAAVKRNSIQPVHDSSLHVMEKKSNNNNSSDNATAMSAPKDGGVRSTPRRRSSVAAAQVHHKPAPNASLADIQHFHDLLLHSATDADAKRKQKEQQQQQLRRSSTTRGMSLTTDDPRVAAPTNTNSSAPNHHRTRSSSDTSMMQSSSIAPGGTRARRSSHTVRFKTASLHEHTPTPKNDDDDDDDDVAFRSTSNPPQRTLPSEHDNGSDPATTRARRRRSSASAAARKRELAKKWRPTASATDVQDLLDHLLNSSKTAPKKNTTRVEVPPTQNEAEHATTDTRRRRSSASASRRPPRSQSAPTSRRDQTGENARTNAAHPSPSSTTTARRASAQRNHRHATPPATRSSNKHKNVTDVGPATRQNHQAKEQKKVEAPSTAKPLPTSPPPLQTDPSTSSILSQRALHAQTLRKEFMELHQHVDMPPTLEAVLSLHDYLNNEDRVAAAMADVGSQPTTSPVNANNVPTTSPRATTPPTNAAAKKKKKVSGDGHQVTDALPTTNNVISPRHPPDARNTHDADASAAPISSTSNTHKDSTAALLQQPFQPLRVKGDTTSSMTITTQHPSSSFSQSRRKHSSSSRRSRSNDSQVRTSDASQRGRGAQQTSARNHHRTSSANDVGPQSSRSNHKNHIKNAGPAHTDGPPNVDAADEVHHDGAPSRNRATNRTNVGERRRMEDNHVSDATSTTANTRSSIQDDSSTQRSANSARRSSRRGGSKTHTQLPVSASPVVDDDDGTPLSLLGGSTSEWLPARYPPNNKKKHYTAPPQQFDHDEDDVRRQHHHHQPSSRAARLNRASPSPHGNNDTTRIHAQRPSAEAPWSLRAVPPLWIIHPRDNHASRRDDDDDDDEVHPMFYVVGGGLPTQACCTPRELIVQNNNSDDVLLLRRVEHQHGGDGRGATNKSDDDVFLDLLTGREWLVSPRDGPRSHRHTPTSAANDARVSAPRMIHLHSAANNISKHNAGTQTHVYASATTQTMAAHTSSSDQQPFMLLVPSHRNSSRDHPRTSRDGFFMFGDVPTYSTRTLDSVGTQTAREATSTMAVQTHFLEQRHIVGTSDAEVGVDAAPRRTEALLITPTEAGLCARRISINASHRTSASGSTHSPQTVRHPLPANASAFPSTQHHSFQDVALDDLHLQHPQDSFTNNGAQRPHQQQQHRFSFLTVDGGANTSPMMMSDERQIGANADVGRVAGYTNSPSLTTQRQERAREEHSDDTRTSTSMMHSMATQTVRVEGGTYAWEEPSVSHPRVREHNPSTSTRRHVLEPRIPSATPSAVVRAMQQHTSSSAAMISVDRSPPSTANMMHQRVGAPPLGCSSVGTQHNQVADIHVLRTNQNMLMTMSSPNFRSSTEEGASARGTELSDVRQRPHVQQAVGISPPVSGRTTPHRPSPRALSAQHNSSDHAHHDTDVDVEEDHHDLITPRYHLNALPARNIDDEDGSPHDASPLFVDPPHTHRRLQHNTHPRRTQKTRDDDQQLDLEHTFVEMRVWEQGNPPKHDDDAGAAVPSSAPQRRVTRRNKWGMPSLKKKKAPRSLAQRVERTWKRAMKRAATVATSGQPQNNKHRQSFSQMKMHRPTRGDDIDDAPASFTKQQPSRKLSEKWLGPPDSFVFPSPSAAAQHPRRGVHDHAHAHDTASRGAHPSSSSSPCVRRVDEDGRRPTPRAQRFAFLRRRRSVGRQRRVRRARRSPPRVSLVAQQHIYADQRVTGPRFVFLRRRWSAQRAYRHHAHTHTATQEHGGGKASDVPPPQRMQRRRNKQSEEEHPQRQSMHHDVVAATKPHTSTSSPAARTKIMADVDRHHHHERNMDARPATHRLPRYTQLSRIKSSTAKWVQVQRSRSVRLPRAPSSRKRIITRYARRRTHQRAQQQQQQQQQQPSLHLQEPEASPYVPARPGSRKLRVRRRTRVPVPLMVRPNRAALLRAVHGKEARGPHDRCAVCHHHQLRHGDVHHHGNVARRKPSLKAAAAAPPPKMKKHPSPSSPYMPARPGSRPLRAQRTHQQQQKQRHRVMNRSVTNSGRDRWCAACVRHDAITTTAKVLQRAEVASSPYTPTRPGSRRLRMKKKNSSMQQRTSQPVHVRVPKNASANAKQTDAAPIQKQHAPVSHGDAVARTTHASPQQTHSRRSQPFAPVIHTAPFVVGRMQRYAITPPESSPYVPARVGARTLRTQPRRKGHHRRDSEDQPQQHPTTTTTPHQKRTDDVGKNSTHMTKDGADAPPSATVNDDDAHRAQRRWRSRRVRPLGMRALVRRWINVAPRVYQHLSTPPSPLLTSSAPRRTRSSPQRQKQEARKARRLHHDSRQPPQVDVDAPVKVPSSSPHLVDDDGVRSSRSNDPQQVVVPTTSSGADDDVLSSLSSTSRRSSNKDNGTIESVDALPLDDGVAVSHPHQDADEPLHDEHINATSPTTKEKRRVAAASAATHLLRRQHDVRRQSSRTHSSSPRRQLRLRQTHSRQQPNNNNKNRNRKKPSSKAQKNMWIPQHRVRQQHEQPWSVRRRRFRHRYLRRPPTPLLHRFAAYYETSTMARVHHRWMHHPRQDDSPRNVPLSNPKTRRKRHILHEERTRLRKELRRLRRMAHDRHSTQHHRMKLYITELRRGDGFSKQLRFVPYESAHTVVVAAPKGLHLRSSSPPKPARRVADEDDVHVAHHPGQELLHELPQSLTNHEQEHVFAGNISKELRRRAQRIRQVNTVDVRVDVHRRASLEKQHAYQSLMQHLKYDGEDGRDDVDAHQQQQQEETKKRREGLRARLATLQQRYANNLGCRYLMNETNTTENEMISGTST